MELDGGRLAMLAVDQALAAGLRRHLRGHRRTDQPAADGEGDPGRGVLQGESARRLARQPALEGRRGRQRRGDASSAAAVTRTHRASRARRLPQLKDALRQIDEQIYARHDVGGFTRSDGRRERAIAGQPSRPWTASRRRQAAGPDLARRRRGGAPRAGRAAIGHTGTLDPMATGVLPLAIGRATRLVRFLTASDKDYERRSASVSRRLYDITGRETSRVGASTPTRAALVRALDAFRGDVPADAPGVFGEESRRTPRLRPGARATSRRRLPGRRWTVTLHDLLELRRAPGHARPDVFGRLLRAVARARPRRALGYRRAGSSRCGGPAAATSARGGRVLDASRDRRAPRRPAGSFRWTRLLPALPVSADRAGRPRVHARPDSRSPGPRSGGSGPPRRATVRLLDEAGGWLRWRWPRTSQLFAPGYRPDLDY